MHEKKATAARWPLVFSLVILISPFKRHHMRHRIRRLNPALAVVEVDQHVLVVAHAKFLHVAELAMAVPRLDSLHQVVVVFFLKCVYEIHTCRINGTADADVLVGAAKPPMTWPLKWVSARKES